MQALVVPLSIDIFTRNAPSSKPKARMIVRSGLYPSVRSRWTAVMIPIKFCHQKRVERSAECQRLLQKQVQSRRYSRSCSLDFLFHRSNRPRRAPSGVLRREGCERKRKSVREL